MVPHHTRGQHTSEQLPLQPGGAAQLLHSARVPPSGPAAIGRHAQLQLEQSQLEQPSHTVAVVPHHARGIPGQFHEIRVDEFHFT